MASQWTCPAQCQWCTPPPPGCHSSLRMPWRKVCHPAAVSARSENMADLYLPKSSTPPAGHGNQWQEANARVSPSPLCMLFGADEWHVPLPNDMEALIEELLEQYSLAEGSTFCSAAFQSDLQAFLQTQARSYTAFCLGTIDMHDCHGSWSQSRSQTQHFKRF